MHFDDLDTRLRVYETSHDQFVPSDVFVVARLDGRGFTRLTKEVLRLEAPFDLRFHEAMAAVVEHLMGAGIKVLYGYTQSDEISLLFDPAERAFAKVRKYLSILAGEASGHLSLALGRVAVFDARLSLLPSVDLVGDYFRWRQEDARRNSLSAYGYWEQRKRGVSVTEATGRLEGMSIPDKLVFVAGFGIDFETLPAWQKLGVGVLWETYQKEGRDPRTGATVMASRRRLRREMELPGGEAYGNFVWGLLPAALPNDDRSNTPPSAFRGQPPAL